MSLSKLLDHISVIPDYRQQGKIDHKLMDILLLTVCAVISGAEGWGEITDFGRAHLGWLKIYGDFANGIPTDDTIARVVSSVNPKKFQECFVKWMQDCHAVTDGKIIAVDGKTVRRSYDKSKRKGAIHMVSAFSTANSVVVGQVKTSAHSNEITAIPELLNLLDIKDKLITIDAMGCQKDIAEFICKKEGDYLLAVKGNQGKLYDAFGENLSVGKLNEKELDSYSTTEISHGRHEIRIHAVSDVTSEFIDFGFEWKNLKKLCVALSFRSEGKKQDPRTEPTVRYYISSANLTAREFAEATREHWYIETKLHWRLDIAMKEDQCRIRRGEASEILSEVRHIAINMLILDKSFKAGLKRKMKRAA
ncbi:ISAs1 family transposase, partial [Salmonella enterica subsp. enterica]|nr:ISAs1 family transposase [Salmonella enterica subsp. enterica]EHW9183327.1 ISAs1 family transposase [Salmonella enterica subsp. enterica]EKS4618715.1 ISAs1 family transposase [Salmonella enterica]EKS4946941.1 ISAs1 family transposase [Salmonella enterica]